MNNKGNELVVGALALGVVVGGVFGIGEVCNRLEYSKGVRTGVINKFSEKGVIWKTCEGQMALEGIVSSQNYVGANVWEFSLDRLSYHGENGKELITKIEQALDKGSKVKVTYVQPFIALPWRSSTDYLVVSIEPVKN